MAQDHEHLAAKPPTIETTSLLPKKPEPPVELISFKPIHRVLLCGFLVSLSFSVTQVPILYVFRMMTCEAYYETHPLPPSGLDRCSVPEIEAGTARAVALLSCMTTFFGVLNLFITGQGIKRLGAKSTLAFQVFWPAVRLAVQNVGVMVGGSVGIIIMDCSQIITIIGGPAGYMLALNTFVAETTTNSERTGYLGMMQGCNMFGAAIGFLVGGILADIFSIITPFQVTFGLFVSSTLYVLLCLPWIYIAKEEKAVSKSGLGLSLVLGPFKALMPSRWILKDGRVERNSGAIFLAAGVFLTVLATGYIPTILQMYATDIFDFGTRRNSYLVSSQSFLRGMFLTLAFPRIIAGGRKLMERHNNRRALESTPEYSDIITTTEQGRMAQAMQDEAEPDTIPPKVHEEQETYDFDLIYTRFSVLVDGIITLGAAFVQQGWQMYLIGALLPFGAGTASAAKGTILQMCPVSERTDALSAISLVEMIARLSTTFVFGFAFAAFASIEKTYLVFVCNAGVALLGFAILLFSHFPPEGSKRLDTVDSSNTAENGNETSPA